MARLRVSVMGNLGADPEVRYTAKGSMQVTMRIAVNQVRMNQDGERQETTEWFRINVGGSKAEYVQRFTKGNRVLVDGRLVIERYQRKDGSPDVGFTVWADDIQNLSPRGDQPEGDEEGYAPAPRQQQQQPPQPATSAGARQRAAVSSPPDLEDLPF